mmetsp:Transcript_33437/g.54238  ORF Transcript_33437/g.54238 Transcript_33437/m.54238 type:complete len:146 (+) Transcript_33437:481-918(+)
MRTCFVDSDDIINPYLIFGFLCVQRVQEGARVPVTRTLTLSSPTQKKGRMIKVTPTLLFSGLRIGKFTYFSWSREASPRLCDSTHLMAIMSFVEWRRNIRPPAGHPQADPYNEQRSSLCPIQTWHAVSLVGASLRPQDLAVHIKP